MIQEYKGIKPVTGKGCYIHETAVIIGEVILNDGVSVWPGAVLRGDTCRIEIGKGTNIQDNAVLHGGSKSKKGTIVIGQNVTIGHGAILHGCSVGDGSLIGMGAILLDDTRIGRGSMIGAGTLVPPGRTVAEKSLAVGNPYKILRELTETEQDGLLANAREYSELARDFNA